MVRRSYRAANQHEASLRIIQAGFTALALLLVLPAAAQPSCPQHFAGGQPPALVNPRLATKARPLCYRMFGVLHSGLTRTPLWSAERLTRDTVEAAREVRRINLFHPEDQLPADEQAELSDYARSGFDRGHMTPSGNMPDPDSQADSFTLANMVPQNHPLNTGLWSDIEGAVRALARREGELHVVTGPLFVGEQLQALRGRVFVPSHVWKAVLNPRTGRAAAYLSPNTDNAGYEVVSMARLRELSGLDVFPSLPEAAKAEAGSLPQPRARGRRGPQDGGEDRR